jgi:hypothetical protein
MLLSEQRRRRSGGETGRRGNIPTASGESKQAINLRTCARVKASNHSTNLCNERQQRVDGQAYKDMARCQRIQSSQ